MRGTLVFDHLTDIVYINCCVDFIKHVAKLAETQGLVASEHSTMFGKGKKLIDPNILIQLFSPLVTSQRFMRESFGNPYTSVQCEDGTNIVFEQYMGFLFLRIGTEEIPFLRRALGVCITLISYLCGPDVALLKASPSHAEELDNLLKTWTSLQSCDQSFLVEALEQLTITPQLSTSLIKSLQQISGKVQIHNEHVHALLIHDTKLLSWYSSKGAHEMSPQDILVLMVLCQKNWPGGNLRSLYKKRINYSKLVGECSTRKKNPSSSSDSESSETSAGLFSSREDLFDSDDFVQLGTEEDEEIKSSKTREIKHYVILLKSNSQFIPHRVHIGMVQEDLYLVLLVEPPTSQLISSLCTSIQMAIDFNGARREVSRDKQYFDVMDTSMKKIYDLLKKQKNMTLRNELNIRWDRFKTGFNAYLKSKDSIGVQVNPVIDCLMGTFRAYYNDHHIIFDNPKIIQPLANVWKKIKADTNAFWGFLKLQTSQNLSLGARETLSIRKFLEDFPGLVHFIYVDRSRHSVTMPALDFVGDDTVILTRRKIWSMVKFAREHMLQGHFSLMWKDSAFNFAYFLWFEDLAGNAIRPKSPPSLPWDGYPLLPGILCGDFYKRLVHECFPGAASAKVRCLELFCIHLGLITSSCVLEHSKRLASTIYDVTGINSHIDIL